MTFSVGFVSGTRYQHNDMPAASLPENTIGFMVGHLNGFRFPGSAQTVEVYADGALVGGYTINERCVVQFALSSPLYLITLQLPLRIRPLRRSDALQCDGQLVVQAVRHRPKRLPIHAHRCDAVQ